MKYYIFYFAVIIFFLFNCSEYRWEKVTTDAENRVNILGVISMDSTINSFVKVHRTIQPSDNDKIILRYDTTAYDTGAYDYYYETVRKLNYEYRDSEVIISSSDGDYQFFPVIYKYKREFKNDNNAYRVMEEVMFEDTLGIFKPEAGRNYFLKITTPNGKVVTAETTVPEVPKIDKTLLPDTLYTYDDLNIHFLDNLPYKKITLSTKNTNHRGEEKVMSENQQYYTFERLYLYIRSDTDTLNIKTTAYDKHYFDYFMKDRDDEVISFMLGESDHGLNVGIEGGIGVFGSIATYETQIIYNYRNEE